MDNDSVGDLLDEIENLQVEMSSLQTEKDVIDAFFISLLFLVILAWVHYGGLKRIVFDEIETNRHIHFHFTDIMMVSYGIWFWDSSPQVCL